MEERDRHIVTFNSDKNSIEPEEPNENNSAYDVDVDTESYSDPYAQDVNYDTYRDEEQTPIEPLHVKPVKERKYVTRGALVLCMILTYARQLGARRYVWLYVRRKEQLELFRKRF